MDCARDIEEYWKPDALNLASFEGLTVQEAMALREAEQSFNFKRWNRRRHGWIRRQRIESARLLKTHTTQEWRDLIREMHRRCVICGIRLDTKSYRGDESNRIVHKDHIVPVASGGSDGIENLQPLCALCHWTKKETSFNWVVYRRANGWPGGPFERIWDLVTA